MEILVDNKLAKIKTGSNFQFIAENRSFTSSDSYTLAITFPLKGCPDNVNIFGNIYRVDIDKNKIVYDCVIRDKSFVKYGKLTITEVSDTEIKGQFLEGRAAQNYDETFDEIYIDELEIGSPEDIRPATPFIMAQVFEDYGQTDYVALPWVNNTSGNIQNEYTFENGKYTAPEGLSYQPYMLFIIKRIFEILEYSLNITALENSQFRHLIICNALPWARGDNKFQSVLPHWSVTEFITELENLLCCEFDIDHNHKIISVRFSTENLNEITPVILKKVVDEYSVSVTQTDESNFKQLANLTFSDCDNIKWKFYDAAGIIKDDINMITYNTWDDFVEKAIYWKDREGGRDTPGNPIPINHVCYVKDIDTHFILLCVDIVEAGEVAGHKVYKPYNVPVAINQFGDKIYNEDSENSTELNIVPAWIDWTDKGYCVFLTVPDDKSDGTTGGGGPGDLDYNKDSVDDFQTMYGKVIEKGIDNSKSETYSKLYVAFWDKQIFIDRIFGLLPSPIIDKVTFFDDWQITSTNYSLRLNGTIGELHNLDYNIQPNQKYTFKFISDVLPNPRAIFYINNKKYICAKLTAQFTESGMSELITGDFYLSS